MVIAKKANLRDRLDDCTLDLSMMDWEEVPVKDIALIKKGTNLDLSMNKITSLGNNFAVLTHITRLDLSKNLLDTLPDNFGDLVLLKHLDLYSNRLTHLPLSLGKLKALRWLDLKDNPLVPVLAEKAGQCLDPKQCQTCARTVVTFLTDMQQKVEDTRLELERKREEEQKKEEEQRLKEENTSSKKKKKAKAKAEKKKENGVKSNAQQPAAGDKAAGLLAAGVKPVVKSAKKANKQAPGGSCLRTMLKVCAWTLLAAMLVVNALLVLRAVDNPRYLALHAAADKVWAAFVDKLPTQVRDAGSQVAEAATPRILEAGRLIGYGGRQLSLKVQHGYAWVSTHEYCRPYIAHARSFLDSVYTRVADMYRSMS